MNRRSSRRDNKILLDTSCLLPILGFETSQRIMKVYRKIVGYELFYSDLSILEALWKALKVVKGTDEEISRIKGGITAIEKTLKYVNINGDAVANAVKMYKLGHKDMIDNILYSISYMRNLKFLTVDGDLVRFLEKHNLPRNIIITPEELE